MPLWWGLFCSRGCFSASRNDPLLKEAALPGCHVAESHRRSRLTCYQGRSPAFGEFSWKHVCILSALLSHTQFSGHLQGKTFPMTHTLPCWDGVLPCLKGTRPSKEASLTLRSLGNSENLREFIHGRGGFTVSSEIVTPHKHQVENKHVACVEGGNTGHRLTLVISDCGVMDRAG